MNEPTQQTPSLTDNATQYGWISIAFHWICAVLIVFLFGLGVYMRGLDYYSDWYHRAPELHIALGMLVFLLMSLRLFWRVKSVTPAPIPGQKSIAILAATLIKVALYLLVFLICVTGYLVTSAEGHGAQFFDWFTIPSIVELSPNQSDLAEAIHKYAAWSVVILAGLHGAAALAHHFIFRDNTLRRMLRPENK